MKSIGEEKEAEPPLLSTNQLSDENLQIILDIRKNKEDHLHSQRILEHIMDILFDALGMLLCGIDSQHAAKSSSWPNIHGFPSSPKDYLLHFFYFFLLSSQARWSWRPISDHFVHTIFFMW